MSYKGSPGAHWILLCVSYLNSAHYISMKQICCIMNTKRLINMMNGYGCNRLWVQWIASLDSSLKWRPHVIYKHPCLSHSLSLSLSNHHTLFLSHSKIYQYLICLWKNAPEAQINLEFRNMAKSSPLKITHQNKMTLLNCSFCMAAYSTIY